MSRRRGLVTFIGGMVLIVLGCGKVLSLTGKVSSMLSSNKELARLVHDPFAFLGLVVLVIGPFVAANGLRCIVLGAPRKR